MKLLYENATIINEVEAFYYGKVMVKMSVNYRFLFNLVFLVVNCVIVIFLNGPNERKKLLKNLVIDLLTALIVELAVVVLTETC